jgi:hypothetical protein
MGKLDADGKEEVEEDEENETPRPEVSEWRCCADAFYR